MKFEYKTSGTCSSKILFDIDDGIGNLQGLSRLVEGMPVDEVISRVQGIHCGAKPTSCPDQLAQALLQAKEKLAAEKNA